MKQNKNELDVDFIGGLGSLTKDEEIGISELLKSEKAKRQKQHAKLIAPPVKRKNLQHN